MTADPLVEPVEDTDQPAPTDPALPPVLEVAEAGQLLGLCRSAAYQLVKDGAWPTPVLRLGRRWRVPTAPLLALLGIEHLDMSLVGARLRRSPTAPDSDLPSGDRS